MDILSSIYSPADIKKLTVNEMEQLAVQLRKYVIDLVSTQGGHLGASLGVVELTLALHYVFDTPNDVVVWDVGHQAYIHKIVTGRKDDFFTNRKFGGISGFPKRLESVYDAFGTGHSSTSISAVLGMALANELKGNVDCQHIAVIGDASIASGMAFEALNHLGVTDANVLVILNDNSIGIDPSVGALKNYFTAVKSGERPHSNIIKDLNIAYFGPFDGHDLPELIKVLQRLKELSGPKFLHITTTKGKGLKQAEEQQVTYHAPGKFDKISGDIYQENDLGLPPKYQDVFGETLVKLASVNFNIVGITPAMLTGSSLKMLMDAYPKRTFDVGIAEQHAVTLAAGMATQGLQVYCNIYSTFLQRAYDQIIHDVALQNLPVIFCLDRAGLVGEDGATHHGVFDMAYLNCIPNIQIFAPLNEIELQNILYTVQTEPLNNPIAIRYPRGRGEYPKQNYPFKKIPFNQGICLQKGSKVAIISTGTVGNNVQKALSKLSDATLFSHYHFGYVKPLDTLLLQEIFDSHTHILTVEDGVVNGGFGSQIVLWSTQHLYTLAIETLGVPDTFIEQGTIEQLQEMCGYSVTKLWERFASINQKLLNCF